MTRESVRWLPPLAVASFGLGVLLIVIAAGSTLGYDYQAYVAAARHVLNREPLYDSAVSEAIGFAVFLYPPQFAVAMIPFALLDPTVGLWAWLALIVAAFVAGVWLLPVRREVRWAVVLLAGLSWPFLYSIKLGQVGPLLFLAFAIGWRYMDRPVALGASAVVGTLIKLQPGLVFVWALATRRWRAVGVGIVVAAAATATTLLLVGASAFGDYLALLGRINKPVTTTHNFTPGAIAYQLGVPESSAALLQIGVVVGVLAVTVFAWFRASPETSYIVTVVASQLLSPVLWEHYAMLLLIPTALLLQRGHWWAAAIPLAGWVPGLAYPITFAVALLAPFLPTRVKAVRRGPLLPSAA